MAQQRGGSSKRSGSSSRSGGSKSSGSKSPASKSSGGRSSSRSSGASKSRSSASASGRKTASRSSSGSSGSAAKRKAAAKKGGQARGRQQKARKTAKTTASGAGRAASAAGIEAKTVAEFRESLRKNLIRPLDLVMLTRERIEEVLDEAVGRGRMTADDAQSLANGLIQRGRKQTNEVLKDLEQLVGRGRDEIDDRTSSARRGSTEAARGARQQVQGAARAARTRAVKAGDPVLAQADRVRRAAGVGPSFPVTGYDDLTAAQITGRLTDLTPAELRKVRDYERRHANRKSVLNSIETKLG